MNNEVESRKGQNIGKQYYEAGLRDSEVFAFLPVRFLVDQNDRRRILKKILAFKHHFKVWVVSVFPSLLRRDDQHLSVSTDKLLKVCIIGQLGDRFAILKNVGGIDPIKIGDRPVVLPDQGHAS